MDRYEIYWNMCIYIYIYIYKKQNKKRICFVLLHMDSFIDIFISLIHSYSFDSSFFISIRPACVWWGGLFVFGGHSPGLFLYLSNYRLVYEPIASVRARLMDASVKHILLRRVIAKTKNLKTQISSNRPKKDSYSISAQLIVFEISQSLCFIIRQAPSLWAR